MFDEAVNKAFPDKVNAVVTNWVNNKDMDTNLKMFWDSASKGNFYDQAVFDTVTPRMGYRWPDARLWV